MRARKADPESRAVPPPAPRRHRRRIVVRCRSVADLRGAAQARLPRGVFDFIDGGSDDERTLAGNSDAFARFPFRPRVLEPVGAIDTSARILEQESRAPYAIGPTGAVGFSWPRGELALAAAARQAGIPLALSSTSTVSIEHVASAGEGRLWFQCYMFRDREFTRTLIERARSAGYEALMITVDLPVGGNRERDSRNDFALPFRYTPKNLLDFARHPEWAFTMLREGTPVLANITELAESRSVAAAASSVGRNYDPDFDWTELERIRDLWGGRMIVKGVSRGDDAARLVGMGVDAVVVSNHGGRQLDGAIPTLLALPEVASAVDGRAQVLLDGGIRRGGDIVKALALGADAVLLGRATLYGVAAGGEPGASRALAILGEEMTRVMQLCGCRRIPDIAPDLLSPKDVADAFEPDVLRWLQARSRAAPEPDLSRPDAMQKEETSA